MEGKKKTDPKTVVGAIFLVAIFVFGFAFCSNIKNSSGDSTTSTINKMDTSVSSAAVKTDLRSPEKKFIDDKMDSLIRSASSLVDLTWNTTVAESVDNYQLGQLSAESTISDLELAKQLYNSKITELENFKAPDNLDFSASAKIFMDATIESLSKAIQGRIEVIDYLIESVNKGSLGEDTAKEIQTRLIVPNTNLEIAANHYKQLLENID